MSAGLFTVASAMSNQKLVLEQVNALNTTTAGMIDTTGVMASFL